jgi:hypothetical protein
MNRYLAALVRAAVVVVRWQALRIVLSSRTPS